MLIHAGSLIHVGIAPREACRVALARPITDDPDMLSALDGFIDAYFGV
jgi:nitric oxide reductase NorQ protein